MLTRNLAVLIFDDVEVLDFCGPFEVFMVASRSQENKDRNRREVWSVEDRRFEWLTTIQENKDRNPSCPSPRPRGIPSSGPHSGLLRSLVAPRQSGRAPRP